MAEVVVITTVAQRQVELVLVTEMQEVEPLTIQDLQQLDLDLVLAEERVRLQRPEAEAEREKPELENLLI